MRLVMLRGELSRAVFSMYGVVDKKISRALGSRVAQAMLIVD
jgi:hypothetical protein